MEIKEVSILVVEDNPDILLMLKDILSKHFRIIYTAINGAIAHQIVRDFNPDLVLTDINMPEVSGLDFILKMRAEGQNMPVIMISSSMEKNDFLKSIKLGVKDFIEKPFTTEDVENSVYRALEIKKRSSELTNLSFLFGINSKEVKHQTKIIGLLQALNTKR